MAPAATKTPAAPIAYVQCRTVALPVPAAAAVVLAFVGSVPEPAHHVDDADNPETAAADPEVATQAADTAGAAAQAAVACSLVHDPDVSDDVVGEMTVADAIGAGVKFVLLATSIQTVIDLNN
jgi:hypothetical protein